MRKILVTFETETTFDIKELLDFYQRQYDGKYYRIRAGITLNPKQIRKVEIIQ